MPEQQSKLLTGCWQKSEGYFCFGILEWKKVFANKIFVVQYITGCRSAISEYTTRALRL